jgi:integrase
VDAGLSQPEVARNAQGGVMVFRREGKTIYSAKVPTQGGVWIEKSTGTKDRTTAREIDAMVLALGPEKSRAWDVLERLTAKPPRLTLALLFDIWQSCDRDLRAVRAKLDDIDLEPMVATWAKELANPARGLAPDTREHYVAAVRLLIPKGTPFLRSDATSILCETWVAEMTCAAGTVRKRVSGASDFFSWLVRRGKLAANPLRDVELPEPGKPRDKWLTTEQIIALADAKAEPYRRLDYYLAATASDLESAILSARRGDIDLTRWTARVHGTKSGNRTRTVVVPTWARDEIRALCAGKLPHAKLFADIPNRWNASDYHRQIVMEIQQAQPWLAGYWLKDHRHSFGVRLAKAGTPMQVIAKLMGNTLQMAVKVYTPYAPSQTEVEHWEALAAAQDAQAKAAGAQSP